MSDVHSLSYLVLTCLAYRLSYEGPDGGCKGTSMISHFVNPSRSISMRRTFVEKKHTLASEMCRAFMCFKMQSKSAYVERACLAVGSLRYQRFKQKS